MRNSFIDVTEDKVRKKRENLRPTAFLHTVSHSPLSPVGSWWETVYLCAPCFLFFFRRGPRSVCSYRCDQARSGPSKTASP